MDANKIWVSEICWMMYVYILTNPRKEVLYVGVTNNLRERIRQHEKERGKFKTFAGRYFCNKLIYFEIFDSPTEAIMREKEIKNMSRISKFELIKKKNTYLHFYRM